MTCPSRIRNHDMALNSYHDMARTDIAGTGTGTIINDQKRTLDMARNGTYDMARNRTD
jgi:hypothetical protein